MVTKFFKEFAGNKAAFVAAGHESTYANNIVFIKDEANNGAGSCIYARGSYFGNFSELIAALAFVKGVKVGTDSYNAANGGGYVEFAVTDPSKVTLDVQNGKLTFGLTPTFVQSVNDVIAQAGAIAADYLTSADKTTLEGLIATAKAEAIAEVKGNAETDTKDSKTIEGVRKYVDDKTSGIASEGVVTDLSNRVQTIEGDYLKTADKNELAGRIKAVEDDYLKGADKTELNQAIEAVGTRVTNEAPVTMTEAEGTGNILKTYTFTQNGKAIGTINLAKELVVTAGEIVEEDGVKYLELTIANQTEKVRIAVTDLVDVYKQGDYITIAADNTISVDKAGIIEGLATDANAQQYANDAKAAAISDAEGKLAAAIEAEVSRADAAYDAKNAASSALAEAKTYAEGEADAAEAAAKSYADGLAGNYATAAQGAKADAAAPADTVYTKAEIEAMFAWETIA